MGADCFRRKTRPRTALNSQVRDSTTATFDICRWSVHS